MITDSTKLYNTLMQLVEKNEAFYFQDFEMDGATFRVFNYRLASYTDFLNPGALEARGIMFEINDAGECRRLACRPQTKFFNLNENPLTTNLDLSKTRHVGLKVDGSLISTFYVERGLHFDLRLKSKGSLYSDQAVAATAWLNKHEQAQLQRELDLITGRHYTVNMEWCAPDNRVVIGYQVPQLVILNIRDNFTGELYVTLHDFNEATLYLFCTEAINNHWVDQIVYTDPVEFTKSIPSQQGVEGYVITLNDGTSIKVKTEWYLVQHRAKDSINSDRRLFEAVLEEATDDLRSLFHDDPLVIQRIADMELRVEHIYNHMVRVVEDYYDANKHLDRKNYAIKGQRELERLYFGLAMNKYVGKADSYKQFMIKHYSDFGITDDAGQGAE